MALACGVGRCQTGRRVLVSAKPVSFLFNKRRLAKGRQHSLALDQCPMLGGALW